MTNSSPAEPTVVEIIIGLWGDVKKHRRLFIIVLLVALVGSVALALILPEKYRAKATIMPPASQGNMSGLLSSFGPIAGISNLGGNGSSADLYPVLARSRRIISKALVHPFGDSTIEAVLLKGQPADSTSQYLLLLTTQEEIQASKSLKTGVVTLSYTHEDPYFAATFVNALLEEMDKFYNEEMKSEAHSQRVMLEKRLASVADSLKVQENRVLRFQMNNRNIRQSPKLSMLENRLLRELEIGNGIYLELTRQYELIKIQAQAEEPVLKILDRATVPMINYWPERRKLVLVSLLIAFVLTLLWVKTVPHFRQV